MQPKYMVKDPQAVLDFTFDWSSWLNEGETIANHSVTVTRDDTMSLDHTDVIDGTVIAWVRGGTHGRRARLLCHIVTSVGREDERSMNINVTER